MKAKKNQAVAGQLPDLEVIYRRVKQSVEAERERFCLIDRSLPDPPYTPEMSRALVKILSGELILSKLRIAIIDQANKDFDRTGDFEQLRRDARHACDVYFDGL